MGMWIIAASIMTTFHIQAIPVGREIWYNVWTDNNPTVRDKVLSLSIKQSGEEHEEGSILQLIDTEFLVADVILTALLESFPFLVIVVNNIYQLKAGGAKPGTGLGLSTTLTCIFSSGTILMALYCTFDMLYIKFTQQQESEKNAMFQSFAIFFGWEKDRHDVDYDKLTMEDEEGRLVENLVPLPFPISSRKSGDFDGGDVRLSKLSSNRDSDQEESKDDYNMQRQVLLEEIFSLQRELRRRVKAKKDDASNSDKKSTKDGYINVRNRCHFADN